MSGSLQARFAVHGLGMLRSCQSLSRIMCWVTSDRWADILCADMANAVGSIHMRSRPWTLELAQG